MIRVLIIDGYSDSWSKMRRAFNEYPGITVAGDAVDSQMALELCRRETVDVILMNFEILKDEGLCLAQLLKSSSPQSKIGPSLFHVGNVTI